MTRRQEQLVRALRRGPHTTEELMGLIGGNRSVIWGIIRTLRQRGVDIQAGPADDVIDTRMHSYRLGAPCG